MNKNIKRIISLSLALGTISAAAPATNNNLLTTKAYASNDDADDLDSIELEDEDGDSVELYTDDDYDDEVDDDLDEGETYYAEVTTGGSITINSVDGPDDDNVRIFEGSDEYEVGDSISLDDGTTTLEVRVYEDEYDEDEDYDSSDYNEYKIKVEYDDEDDDDDDDNDEDTLDSLELNDQNEDSIKMYSDSEYEDEVDSDEVEEGETYYAKTSSNEVVIETDGPDDDYVKVFKNTSDSTEGVDPGDTIAVSEDKTLTVRIYDEEPDSDITYEDDEDVIGEYEIKLDYTGSDSSNSGTTTTGTSGTTTATTQTDAATIVSTTSTAKPNQWVQVNGSWQYNDSLGNPLKSQWHHDGSYGAWYYLGANGVMSANQWISSGGRWYYLGTSGAMSTNSWILSGSKWYYLGTDGAMVTNTTISGYKIGADGAWIK